VPSSDGDAKKAFQRLVFITRDDLLAARWWHEGMQQPAALAPNRRAALSLLLGMGGLVGAGMLLRGGCHLFGDPAITMDALDLQRKEGWSVGAGGQPLLFPNRVPADSAGSTSWAASLGTLGRDLSPNSVALDPYAVRTLFDVFNNPRGAGLSQVIAPVHGIAMDVAEHAAQALATLFSKDEDWKQTALIIDMPGPESVAAAAGVAEVFAPVFLYDNWPHPLGVVPSHETLAAALYYRPTLLQKRAQRQAAASPAFVLDSRRLSPYRDESDRFDNRYLAKVPDAESLGKLGIKRILYVTATAQAHELDDLNDDFVALKRKDMDVKMVALSDFAPASEELLRDNRLPLTEHRYFYGGHPYGSYYFWSSYHWSSPTVASHSFRGSLPRTVSAGPSFSPVARPTLFSSRTVGGLSGVGKQKPSGFGRVSYRSGSSSLGRSGSFGRVGSSSFG
jgi:hypothetical protein